MVNIDKHSVNDGFAKSFSDKAEISIWFDTYEDIFSDFDPRPFLRRTLSIDFVDQIKRMAKDLDNENIILKLLLLGANRNKKDEEMIIKKLHFYFENNRNNLLIEKKKITLQGFKLLSAGLLFMLASSFISFSKSEVYYMHLLLVLLEPAGWFLLWMGLDDLTYYSRITKNDIDFFSKMTNSKIEFGSY